MTLSDQDRAFLRQFSQSAEAKTLKEIINSIIMDVKDDVLEEKLSAKEGKNVINKLVQVQEYLTLDGKKGTAETNFV